MAAIGFLVLAVLAIGYGITLVSNTFAEERRRNGTTSTRRPSAPDRPALRVVFDCPNCGPGVVFMVGGDATALQAATGMYTTCWNCGNPVGPTRLAAE